MNKKIFKFIIMALLCTLLVSCGPSADRITILTSKYQEAIGLYDSMAPIVAKLDDLSVEKYEEAGATVRKAKRAIDSGFESYDDSETDKLIADLETAMLILRSFEGREPVKPVLKEENGTVFTVNFINHSGKNISSILLKSGSGSNDVKLEYSTGFAHEATIAENIQVPESESFTLTATYDDGEETAFAGTFYLSTVSHVTLTNDEGKYLLTTELIE